MLENLGPKTLKQINKRGGKQETPEKKNGTLPTWFTLKECLKQTSLFLWQPLSQTSYSSHSC